MHTTTKVIILASAIIALSFGQSFGAMNVTHDPQTGETTYREHFKLNGTVSEEQAFEFIQQWFTQSPGKFSRQNQEVSGATGGANKAAVEEAFKNSHPLQSIDPESNRVVGRSMVKYCGGSNSSIKLMYIEYYVVLEIHGQELTATISQIKYHHFNSRNYAPQVIYNWQGGRPFDSSDRFDALTSSPSPNQDITNVSSFLNSDISKLMNDLKAHLKGNNALASNS